MTPKPIALLRFSGSNPIVGVLAFALVMIACMACGPTSAGSSSAVSVSADAPRTDEPETLAAATAAAQANVDGFTSGDFGRVWEGMERGVRDRITKADFVTYYETCKKPGPRLRVMGERLDSRDEAIVLVQVRDVARYRTMVYEDGRWSMKATDEFAKHLGEPVAQIIDEETAAGLCIR